MSKKARLLECYRHINVEYEDWYHDIYENFTIWMRHVGVDLAFGEITHSGFCSQGDGASFCTRRIEGVHFDTFAQHHGLYESYPILKLAYEMGCDPVIKMYKNTSHYCHEGTVYAEIEVWQTFENLIPFSVTDDDIRLLAARTMDEQLEREVFGDREDALNDAITEDLRWYMRQLYRALDSLYYKLVSDEEVWEAIINSDIELGDEYEDS